MPGVATGQALPDAAPDDRIYGSGVIRRHASDAGGIAVIPASARRWQPAGADQEQPGEQERVPTEEAGLPGNARQDSKAEEALQNDGAARERGTESVTVGPGDVAARRRHDPPCPKRDDPQCDHQQPREGARSSHPCHGAAPLRPVTGPEREQGPRPKLPTSSSDPVCLTMPGPGNLRPGPLPSVPGVLKIRRTGRAGCRGRRGRDGGGAAEAGERAVIGRKTALPDPRCSHDLYPLPTAP